MKIYLILLLVILSIFPLHAYEWTKVYGGSGNDYTTCIIKSSDNNLLVCGYSNSFSTSGYDIWLLKLDNLGDVIWSKTYGVDNYDEKANEIRQTSDSGYIIVGETNNTYTGNSNIYLLKVDSIGDISWFKTYYDTTHYVYSSGNSVIQLEDNGYIIAGYKNDPNDLAKYLLRVDSLGNVLWDKFNMSEAVYHSIQITENNNYILSAWSMPSFEPYFLEKVDSLGNVLWSKTCDCEAFQAYQTFDSGFIVSGSSKIIKTDSSGDSTWTYPVAGLDLIISTDSNYVAVNSTGGVNLFKVNQNGLILWTKNYNGVGGYSLVETMDRGYAIAATINQNNTDFYIIKTDSMGNTVGVEEKPIASTPQFFSYIIIPISNKNITINFCLTQNAFIELNIFDASGRNISTIVQRDYSIGTHHLDFKIDRSGIYFYEIKVKHISEEGKFIVF